MPDQGHGHDGDQEGRPERQAARVIAVRPTKPPIIIDVALGEIDGFGGLVDRHEAERDQRIDATDRRSADGQLQELQHPMILLRGMVPVLPFAGLLVIMHQAG
jgi:hypothetical protein